MSVDDIFESGSNITEKEWSNINDKKSSSKKDDECLPIKLDRKKIAINSGIFDYTNSITRHSAKDHIKHLPNINVIIRQIIDEMELLKMRSTEDRNEIDILKKDKDKNQIEIEMLKQSVIWKNDRIKSIIEEINLLKDEKRELAILVNVSMQNFGNEIGEKCSRFGRCLEEHRDSIETFRHGFQSTIETIRCNNILYHKQIEKQINNIERKANQQYFHCIIDRMKRWRTDEDENEDEWRWSDFFYGRLQRFKMRLRMTNVDEELWIYLCVYPCLIGDQSISSWPLRALVTIAIVNNNNNNNGCISKTHNCLIESLGNDLFPCSDAFVFQYDDLTASGLLDDDRLIVECFIDFYH